MKEGWLGLCRGTHIPQRDVRKLIWKFLLSYDRIIIRMAHNSNYQPVLTETFSSYCAENGYLDLLKWGRTNVSPVPWDYRTAWSAAFNGHLKLLEWVMEGNGCQQVLDVHEITAILEASAQSGHLQVLQYLTDLFEGKCFSCDRVICYYAARFGHLDGRDAHLGVG